MKKDLLLIALGIWIAVVPFLGLPGMWKTLILVISGLAVALCTVLWRRELLHSQSWYRGKPHDVFVENGHMVQNTNRRRLRVADDGEHPEYDKIKNIP